MIVTKDKETRFSGTSVLPGSEVLHLCDVQRVCVFLKKLPKNCRLQGGIIYLFSDFEF